MPTFSQRHGYNRPQEEITIREEAPIELREYVVELAYGTGYSEYDLREIVCATLRRRPNSISVTLRDYQREIQQLMKTCPWPKVYDVIEKLHESSGQKEAFEEEMNTFFATRGIGWKLAEGVIVFRGAEIFESQLRGVKQVLSDSGLSTAHGEIHEAIQDLSRMPQADITGAIQHSLACLECVARTAAGNGNRQTLGELIKSRRDLVPEPLNTAIEKVWGFSSNQGRHLEEGKEPSFEEAELLVGLAASLSTFLARKLQQGRDNGTT